jgi:hypothetical protein
MNPSVSYLIRNQLGCDLYLSLWTGSVHSPKEPPTVPDERSTLPIVQLAGYSAPVSSTLVPNIDQSVATIEPVSMTAHGPTAIMERILRLAGELEGQCRVCWAEGKAGRMHFSYRCDSGICSGNGWKLFKAKTAFPSGLVCFLCFTTYGPPFNHEVPPPGVKYKGQLCDYSDGLKELAYVIYHSEAKRNAVFARLGHTVPATLVSYWRFIGRKQASGLLGLYEVLSAYLDTREGVEVAA